jgi:deoxyguanosine kinase
MARRLAHVLDATLALDPFADNPFLPQLLADPEARTPELALRVELTFLSLRLAQLRHIEATLAAGRTVVADWALLKQSIFAGTTLDAGDATRVAATVQPWADALPTPNVLIALSAPPAMLRRRVRQRGRHLEANITNMQLATLSAAFERAYLQWNRPLIRLDTTVFNTFDNQHLCELANQIRHLPTLLESR